VNPDRESELCRLAQSCEFGIVWGFASQGQDGTHWGGTLILYDEKTVSLEKELPSIEGITRASFIWNDRKLELASVYAPATPSERNEFFVKLKRYITKSTIAGGDWNCVPDVTLDATGPGAARYGNQGATVLSTIMTHHEDIHREQLGNEREVTRIGNTVATRLDRWYIPTDKEHDDLLWSCETKSDYVIKKTLDHKPVQLTIETPEGEDGHQRHTINEDMILDPQIQSHITRLVDDAYEKKGNQTKKWERAHASVRDFLLK
jgi:hypothetical protein